jgi:hypothetical protein
VTRFAAVLLLGWASTAAAEPPTDRYGAYRGIPCPRNDLECVPTASSDRLDIARGRDGTPRIKAFIRFDRGHSCAIDAPAEWSGGQLISRAPGATADTPCALTLSFANRTVSIDDPGLHCRILYCGARGTLGGTRFEKRR